VLSDMKEELFQTLRMKKKELEDRLTTCTHNCINEFVKDTGVIVESVNINIDPVYTFGYKRPTALLVDVEVKLEEL
jgi:hypothetical protein